MILAVDRERIAGSRACRSSERMPELLPLPAHARLIRRGRPAGGVGRGPGGFRRAGGAGGPRCADGLGRAGQLAGLDRDDPSLAGGGIWTRLIVQLSVSSVS